MSSKRMPTQAAARVNELREQIQRANAIALEQLADLLRLWLPGGRVEGKEYVCASLRGGQGRSCKINLTTGLWADFATEAKGGDPVSLYAAIHDLHQAEAAKEIEDALGSVSSQPPDRFRKKSITRAASRSDASEQITLPVPPDAPPPPDTRRCRQGDTWIERTVAARWTYRNAQGDLLGYACRFELPDGVKEVVPQVFGKANGRAHWLWKAFPNPRPLYGLDRLAASTADTPILICEGEKTADAAQRLLPNAVAMTWPGGSKAVGKAKFSSLAGRNVVIWPDADKCGYEAAMDVAVTLEKIGTAVHIVSPPEDVKAGWDLADAENEGWTTTKVMHYIKKNIILPSAFTDLSNFRYGIESRCLKTITQQKTIRIESGKADIVDDCETILSRNDLPIEYRIFQRGAQLVRLAKLPISPQSNNSQRLLKSVRILAVEKPFIIEVLKRFGQFEKMSRQGEFRVSDPPKDVADSILARAGLWPMPALRGVLTCPTLRPDGTLLLAPGYDPQSQYYFAHHLNARIPANPTHSEAKEKINLINELLTGFNFVEPVDRAVALSLILSTVVRPMLDHTPLFAITAPLRGSGKSYLMDIASMIATGRSAVVLSATLDRAELEKRLIGNLLSGDQFIDLDNFKGVLKSDLLCQALTADTIKIRPLGASALVEIPNTALWSANGNNLVLSGDLVRRSLLCRLDPGCERPEERRFASNPLEYVRTNRTEYVSAILTIFRAYIVAGQPDMGGKPFGSFSQWSALVRGALMWVGEPDPCASRDAIMDEDPELAQLRALLNLWRQSIGNKVIKIRQLIERATNGSELYEILTDISGEEKGPGGINARRLGHWLKRHKNRIVDGFKLIQVAGTNMASWQVVQVAEGQA